MVSHKPVISMPDNADHYSMKTTNSDLVAEYMDNLSLVVNLSQFCLTYIPLH